jgi:hypothetical protein
MLKVKRMLLSILAVMLVATVMTGSPSAASSGQPHDPVVSEAVGSKINGQGRTSLRTSGEATAPVVSERYKPTRTDARSRAVGLDYSHCWGNSRQGWVTLNLSGMPVNHNQAVTVSISEVDASCNEFLGAATMTVHNVVVTPGQVTAKVFIDWGSPLRFRTHYVW